MVKSQPFLQNLKMVSVLNKFGKLYLDKEVNTAAVKMCLMNSLAQMFARR